MNLISEFRQVIRYWWIFLLLGAMLIFFGVGVFNHPVATYADLTIFFELAFVVNGLLEISFALLNRRSASGWGWHLAGGIFDLLMGILLVSNPILAAVSLPLFVSLWLLLRSISMIGRQFDLPVGGGERLWMLFLGLCGIAFSFLIFYNPALGALTLVTWTSFALIAMGLFYISLGFALRKIRKGDILHKRE
ncbi:MAG: DUF308 domain-containing protein [Puia sp.]|nr:DUF308 domain-containing protein [Puia sp.]